MAFTDIISYEGNNETFVYKFPKTNFNTGAKLIVRESQEAIFIKNGELLDVFGPGRYTLTTENLPIIRSLMKLPTLGKAPFQCELYFVNKVEQMAIKWGTDGKIQYIDPQYGFPIEIGACGEMSLFVNDAPKLLIKLVGTTKVLSRDTLVSYFRAILMNRFKTVLATEIKEKGINIFEIDSELTDLSNSVKQVVESDFAEYGITLNTFVIMTIVKPEDDPQYKRFVELHYRKITDVEEAELQQRIAVIEQTTKARQTLIESDALARKRIMEGYTYQEEKGFEVAKDIAQNDAVAQYGNVGIGLGLMTGIGGEMGRHLGNATSQAMGTFVSGTSGMGPTRNETETAKPADITLPMFCNKCGNQYSEADVFCPKCGNKRGV